MSISEVQKMPGMTLGKSHPIERMAMHGFDAAQPPKKKVAARKKYRRDPADEGDHEYRS